MDKGSGSRLTGAGHKEGRRGKTSHLYEDGPGAYLDGFLYYGMEDEEC